MCSCTVTCLRLLIVVCVNDSNSDYGCVSEDGLLASEGGSKR